MLGAFLGFLTLFWWGLVIPLLKLTGYLVHTSIVSLNTLNSKYLFKLSLSIRVLFPWNTSHLGIPRHMRKYNQTEFSSLPYIYFFRCWNVLTLMHTLTFVFIHLIHLRCRDTREIEKVPICRPIPKISHSWPGSTCCLPGCTWAGRQNWEWLLHSKPHSSMRQRHTNWRFNPDQMFPSPRAYFLLFFWQVILLNSKSSICHRCKKQIVNYQGKLTNALAKQNS